MGARILLDVGKDSFELNLMTFWKQLVPCPSVLRERFGQCSVLKPTSDKVSIDDMYPAFRAAHVFIEVTLVSIYIFSL